MNLILREEPRPDDVRAVRDIVTSTGVFWPAEVDVAVELVQERLARGTNSGYFFVFAEAGEHVVGYACYGPIACTAASYDLYWIAVRPDHQRQRIGELLLRESERRIADAGGRRIYVETSSRDAYAKTRRFYDRCGYAVEAVLADFYAPGDNKVVYAKVLRSAAT